MSTDNPLAHIPPHIQAAIAIAEPAPISEMFLVFARDHNAIVEDYEPIDKQGCWLTPRAPTTAAAFEAAIMPTLAWGHWIVTSLKGNRVLIEPRHTRHIQVEPPGPVYHVTTRDRRAAIQATGLEMREGGNTRMQRKYPPRTFFAINMFAAFEFVEFQCKRNVPVMRPGKQPDWIDPVLLGNTDIWRVRLPDGARLRHDVLFPGKAGWIEQPVPRRNLSLVRYWPIARRAWHCLREYGWV